MFDQLLDRIVELNQMTERNAGVHDWVLEDANEETGERCRHDVGVRFERVREATDGITIEDEAPPAGLQLYDPFRIGPNPRPLIRFLDGRMPPRPADDLPRIDP